MIRQGRSHDFREVDFRGLKQLRQVSKNPDTGKAYTQIEMAAKVGIKQQSYSQIESGLTKNPKPEVVKNIALALGSVVSDLIDALPKTKKEQLPKRKVREQVVIPKYHHAYQPKGFPYNDSLLLENPDSTEAIPSLRHVLGAYAVVMPSDTMEPRYRRGDVLYVNPELQPYYGDDVVLLVRYKNRTVGVVRELLNQEPVYNEEPDPKQSVGLISLKDKEKFSLKRDNKYIDYLDDYLHLSEKADWFVLDEEELHGGEIEDDFPDDGDPNAILAITAHVIVACEKQRWMEQRKPLSNPKDEKPFKDPEDMQEYMLMRSHQVTGEL